MKTKLIPFALAVTVCLGLFTGCQSSKLGSYSADEAKASPSPSATATTTATKDYTPCYESYKPDEVMLTINGIDVTWSELFYWYQYEVSSIESTSGAITDWDSELTGADGKTYRENVMETALDTVKHYCALQSKAKDKGIALSEEDKAQLKTVWDNNVASYGNGDEAAFIEYLKKAFLSKDLYDHINEVSALYTRMLDSIYGAKGEKLPDADVINKATDMGYVRAKHILISTKDDSGAALPDDQKAEKKAIADKLLKELQGITDKTKLEARFDELITEYGKDPGTQYYTDGYSFISGSGKMDPAFDAGVKSLGEYELSIVETDFGYHIIMRLPIKASAIVKYTSETEMTTLASLVAVDMFSVETDSWAKESKVEFSKTYDKMDIAQVFSKAKIAAEASPSAG